MLAYAAHRRSRRHINPPTLIAIVGVHAVALTLLATAKMEGSPIEGVITELIPVALEKEPPPLPPPPTPQPARPTPRDSQIDRTPPIVPSNPQPTEPLDRGPPVADTGPVLGPSVDPAPPVLPDPPRVVPVRPTAPVLATPADQLRPPYPEAKRRLEEEAVLRLRLAIDARGRVTAVEPVGSADPLFLASARGHLVRYWRYRPATEAGQPVATSIVVTLRFRLDEE